MIAPRSALRTVVVAVLALAAGRAIHAQQLRGVVRDSASGLPIPGAVVTLLDTAGALAARTMTNERGQFHATLLGTGVRSVRLVRLGFRPSVARLPAAEDGAIRMDVVMVAIPMSLQPVSVTAASTRCPRRRDRVLALALLEQARAGLLATVVAQSQVPATMKRIMAWRTMDGNSTRIKHQRVRIDSADATLGTYAAAFSAPEFVRNGFIADSNGTQIYYGPDAKTLLDDDFSSGYCFHVMDPNRRRPNQVGLGFRAAERRDGRVDLDGALWIDTVARALVDIEYTYVGMDPRLDEYDPGGQMFFREMPNGTVVIDRWSIRMVGGESTGTLPAAQTVSSPARIAPALRRAEVWGEVALAAWPDTTWRSTLGALRLTLTRPNGTPVSGMMVKLDDTDYDAISDSAGVAAIPDLIPGPYAVSVGDSTLISLGVSIATSLRFTSVREQAWSAVLVVPTARDYVSDRCHRSAPRTSTGSGDGWVIARVMSSSGDPVRELRWSLAVRVAGVERPVLVGEEAPSDGIVQYCQLHRGDEVLLSFRAPGMAETSRRVTLSQQVNVVRVEMKPRR
jgi:hypothetical protein